MTAQHYATIANCPASNIHIYATIERARVAASRQAKAWVVLGEDGQVIVCKPKVAERLVKAGYQYA